MKLDDLNSKFSSKKVSKVLEDKFGTKVELNRLSLNQLLNLKTRIMETHKKTTKSMPFNSGHRNPEYLSQIALLEAIELRINEIDQMDDSVSINQENKKTPMDSESNKKEFTNFTGQQSSALLRLVGSSNITKAKRAIQLAAQNKPIPSNLVVGFKPIVDILLDILQGGSSYVNRLQALDKQASKAAHLSENKFLLEGETEKAQLIMAVKDMVDRVQGMVEDLNKMKVEDLVALTDKMRDEFGQSQAMNFTTGANNILSSGIDALTNARTELDNAVLALTGEAPAPAAELPAGSGEELPAELGTELPAEPGTELPPPEGGEELGRELRESRRNAKRRILESSKFLGKLAK